MSLPTHRDAVAGWRTIRAELRQSLGESTFDIWLAPLELQAFDGDALILDAPPGTRQWIAARYGRLLERCARQALGESTRVVLCEDAGRPRGQHGAGPAPAVSRAPAGPRESFNPRYSFEQYIIGEGNRLAHAAALTVAELPGDAYNPLFLHAPPGLGKTHLLHAIGNYVQAFGGGAIVRYTTAEDFTNHFMGALTTKAIEPFKRAYRDADVLLIDDIQFLAAKARTEEEFFHTFNALRENGRQLVITCDRFPAALLGIEARLRERFEAGLVAEISPPDLPTRVAILRKRAALDQITVTDPAVLELLAARVTQNIRALEGALISVVAHGSLTPPRPPTRHRGDGPPLPWRCGDHTDDRRRAGGGGRSLCDLDRRARLRRTHGADRLAPASGHSPRARSHRCLAAGDRRCLRRPQPRYGAACLQARRRTCRG